MNQQFTDNCFKTVGDNLLISQQNGIDEKIKLGDEVTFISAPRYFGDGYVMPIVAVSIGGECILEFNEGVVNLLSWMYD